MDLFNVIGPVMVGPSSSHTAGAARIGRIARQLLGVAPVRAVIGLHGSFQKTCQGHGTDKALVGGLLNMRVDDLRLRDSLTLAKEQGLSYTFSNVELRHAHPNSVLMDVDGADGTHIQVQASSIGGGEIMVDAIDGLEAGISGHENTLVLTYADAKGMIAAISGVVASAGLNIATMKVFRRSKGDEAMMAVELDGEAAPGLVKKLSDLDEVYRVAYLPADREA